MSSVDVLIIAALKDEFEAARNAANGVGAGNWRERDTGGLTPYLTGEYVSPAGSRITVALARPTGMGGRRTGPLATTLTNQLQPTCLAMCGVCAGNPDDTAPGDVIVAAPAYEYDEGKLSGGKLRGAHEQYPLNDRWLRAAQDFDPAGLPSYGEASEAEATIWFLERLYRSQDAREHPARSRYFPKGTWSQRLDRMETDGLIVRYDGGWALTGAGAAKIERLLDDDVDGPDRLPFAVEPGPIASGSAVVEDPKIWTKLKNLGMRKIRGLEMEAATVATVAHEREVPHWLVVKGVMDNANFDKDDRFKVFASRASAEVLFALLGRVLPTRSAVSERSAGPGLPAAAPTPSAATVATVVPGPVKLEIIRRLHYDWQDLADLVGVPGFERVRFAAGNEPRALWEWLEVRGRLVELPAALDEIGRADLGERLRPHLSA
jgi:nucleoside phosphorylase